MQAIIRHLGSGEHFLAELDESGDAVRLSTALPVTDATDRDSGEVDWAMFADAEMKPWDDPAEAWTSKRFAVVHRFED